MARLSFRPLFADFVRVVSSGCLWISAAILVVLPAVVAADYGGVLRWTHYVASLAAGAAVLLALCSLAEKDASIPRRQWLLVPLLTWLGFAWLQTIALPATAVAALSPASSSAYTDWINPFLTRSQQLTSFPISIARHDSLHACAVLAVVIATAWASAALFHERRKVVLLMGAISLGAAFHAGVGLWRMLFPETEAWSLATETMRTAFGAFVNRNNAALMLNLGLGLSLGLLAWRITALSGLEMDDPTFELNDLLSLTGDRDSLAGLIGAVLCIAGLLVCGSRGGLVAACFGLLLAFGWMRQRRGIVSLPVIGSVIALSVALLLVPLELDLESVRRLDVFSQQDTSTILRDGRLLHWRDGWSAAAAHLPAGSGLSTYAYAYLPHQISSPSAWYHHADNLWLELLTEQGIAGVLLALSIISMVVVALLRLAESPDPIDHGLRIAGWYCLAAIIVSQIFDFGLIVFGNLLVVAILFPAIVSRAQSQGSVPSAWSRVWKRFQILGGGPGWRRVIVAGAALFSAALVYMALPRLQYDARIETLTTSIERVLNRNEADLEFLATLSEELKGVAGADPPPTALDALSDIESRRARYLEVLSFNPRTADEVRQRFRETDPQLKRRQWLRDSPGSANDGPPDSPPASDPVVLAGYEVPFQYSTRSLRVLPLNPRSRWSILNLDFVPRDRALTRAALSQLREFFPNDPLRLVQIGQYAATSGEQELAASILREALRQAPQQTASVLAELDGVVDLQQVVPRHPETLRRAAPYLLRDAERHRKMLQVVLDGIRCETCASTEARSRCEELSGDVAYALGRHQAAFDQYRQAMRFDPANPNLRIKLITRLRDQGYDRAAVQEARLAQADLPEDKRFKEMIESMARARRDDLRSNP